MKFVLCEKCHNHYDANTQRSNCMGGTHPPLPTEKNGNPVRATRAARKGVAYDSDAAGPPKQRSRYRTTLNWSTGAYGS